MAPIGIERQLLGAPALMASMPPSHVAAGILAVQLNTHPIAALDRLRAQSYATGRRITSVVSDVIARRPPPGRRWLTPPHHGGDR